MHLGQLIGCDLMNIEKLKRCKTASSSVLLFSLYRLLCFVFLRVDVLKF